MNATDEAKLRVILAKQLPELIKVTAEDLIEGDEVKDAIFWFNWLDTGVGVTEREWDWIVRQLVGKLTVAQFAQFVAALKTSKSLMPRNAQFMTWQQRGITLLEVLGVKLDAI